MSQTVTVQQGGLEISTNTMSEAALRAELEAPAAQTPPEGGSEGIGAPSAPAADRPSAADGEAPPAAAPARDDKGRFTRSETATPPAELPTPGDAAPESPAPAEERREDLARHDPLSRMKKALAQKAEAERRAAALETELARYRQQAGPGAPAGNGAPAPAASAPGTDEPQFEQFAAHADPYTAYVQAWTRWDNRRQIAETLTAYEQAQQERARTQQFEQRLAEGRGRLTDFETVLTEADKMGLQVSAVMQNAIVESPHAADLVYYLATHPEECTQLAEESHQTPVAAATVMRRLLESRLAPRAAPAHGTGTAARASVSTAKPPVTPVGSSPPVSDEPPGETASAAEHARYWNRRLKVPGAH